MKYPRIPHLPGSKGTEDDVFVKFPNTLRSFRVYEKLDGANAGIIVDEQGIRVRGRSEDMRPHPQWDAMKNWTYNKYQTLLTLREDNEFESVIIYGEWLYAKHTIYYDRLPDFFMVYDILADGTWLPQHEVAEVAQAHGLTLSPCIYETDDVETAILNLLEGHVPLYGDRYEGFIFRADSDIREVYKYVRHDFELGNEHWFDKPVERNKLWVS